jgi:hypothetical protein
LEVWGGGAVAFEPVDEADGENSRLKNLVCFFAVFLKKYRRGKLPSVLRGFPVVLAGFLVHFPRILLLLGFQ